MNHADSQQVCYLLMLRSESVNYLVGELSINSIIFVNILVPAFRATEKGGHGEKGESESCIFPLMRTLSCLIYIVLMCLSDVCSSKYC